MTTTWSTSGVSDSKPFKLDEEIKIQINLEFKAIGLTSDIPAAFYANLEKLIGRFNATQEMKGLSSPATIRKSIDKAINAAHKLDEKLNNLDTNARQLINQVKAGGATDLQSLHLGKIMHLLSEASHLADEFPKGRLTNDVKLQLAVDIGQGLEKHLDIKATSTKESYFVSILTIIFELLTDKEVKSINELAANAVKIIKINKYS